MNRLFEGLPDISCAICVDPSSSVAPVRETLDSLFDGQPVSVTNAVEGQDDDVVALRDGDPVASSSIEELLRSILLVNSDVYITGSRSFTETELPNVLKALEEIPFQLQGYPASDSEKLLLITLSRAIERLAYEAGAGTLRSGFQRLSRLVDEPGTARVYNRLCETDLDIHVYGVDDASLPPSLDMTTHTGVSELHRLCWFVVFSPESNEGIPAGMASIQRERNRWEGFWTFQTERVELIEDVITDATSS